MKATETGAQPTIECPKCGTRIGITEALSRTARDHVRHELQAEWEKRRKQREAQFTDELGRANERAAAEARNSALTELLELKAAVAAKSAQVEAMRKTELGLRQRTGELDERAKQLELEVARRLDEERAAVESVVSERLAEKHRLATLEKDRKLAEVTQKLEEATRRVQQGSQQMQGEVLEIDLDERLRREFPQDLVEAVVTGERGADLVHQVRDPQARSVGTLVWEVKNTKAFQPSWIGKLRQDQRNRGAAFAIIVTKTLPDNIKYFGQLEGVWITCPAAAMPLALALRQGLLEVSRAQVAKENQSEKEAALYQYLSGVDFRQRIEAVLDPLLFLLEQQEKEHRALEAGWAKREKALRQAIVSVAVLYGGVNGIVGGTMPTIERLELPPTKENQAA